MTTEIQYGGHQDPKSTHLQPLKIEEKDSIILAGISVITTNAEEVSGKGQLGALWTKFYTDDVSSLIAEKASDGAIYGCYTDYENGAEGRYRLLIGMRVQNIDNKPAGLDFVITPAAKYAVFTTSRGPIQEVVFQAWNAIWQWSETSSMKRTFTGDFEYYDERSADPANAQVDIYIAIE
ncbi:GyrI-like domain-containing protein [Paenibacillus endoradicis]|uniref:GyrI-like domain-containing protein n=1 Tax=Paenibacillus endoradicis TaxID=2972487 RepID=UPI0021596FE2|nr:GyrI-like domain-containing protein [Paenibacillus endoradicis]MCR8659189.1 GyrI-like domain-containing protein [Paenibacillus endoradicis]